MWLSPCGFALSFAYHFAYFRFLNTFHSPMNEDFSPVDTDPQHQPMSSNYCCPFNPNHQKARNSKYCCPLNPRLNVEYSPSLSNLSKEELRKRGIERRLALNARYEARMYDFLKIEPMKHDILARDGEEGFRRGENFSLKKLLDLRENLLFNMQLFDLMVDMYDEDLNELTKEHLEKRTHTWERFFKYFLKLVRDNAFDYYRGGCRTKVAYENIRQHMLSETLPFAIEHTSLIWRDLLDQIQIIDTRGGRENINHQKHRLFSSLSLRKMEEAFRRNPYPSSDLTQKLAQELNEPVDRIKKWFLNKRYALKKSDPTYDNSKREKPTESENGNNPNTMDLTVSENVSENDDIENFREDPTLFEGASRSDFLGVLPLEKPGFQRNSTLESPDPFLDDNFHRFFEEDFEPFFEDASRSIKFSDFFEDLEEEN